MSRTHLRTLRTIVNLPTAPFVEDYVVRFIRDFVASRPRLSVRTDRFGNLLVRYSPKRRPKRKPAGKPILFAAHMDHPGFVARRMIDAGRLEAEWRGWVQERYFPGQKIAFFAGGMWIPGMIEKVIPQKAGKAPKRAASGRRSSRGDAPPKAVIARVKTAVPPGSPGMWGLPDAIVRGNRLACRASDDLSGLAGVICALDEICRKQSRCPCCALFTRAEEVGFAGALAAADGGTIPRGAVIVAVENSKVIPGVVLGDGPVLRVGDKATIFTPAATAYCQVVAEELVRRDKSFRFQRKLMDGGTCESTAYCHYGYEATGICLSLVNYHNMDTNRVKIAPESIDVHDFLNLVKWFVALAESPAKMGFDGRQSGLSKRLDSLLRQHRTRLLAPSRLSRR